MGVARNDAEKVKVQHASGAGSNTKITVADMAVGDQVSNVVNLTDNSNTSLSGLVVEAGGFKITASTSGKNLLVTWIDRSAG